MTTRDGAAVRVPPPLVFLSLLIAGFLLQRLVYSLPLPVPRLPRLLIAAILGATGFYLLGSAASLFKKTGQDPKPWVNTPEIVSTGIYRLTRNPMYVGMALIQLACGLWLSNPWIIALLPLSMFIVQQTAIRHEEAYLEEKFGEGYLEYKRRVRRWL